LELSQYENKVEAKIEEWNARIEKLKLDAQDAGPEKRKEYEEEIDSFIANREAARRGLVRVSESGSGLCSSCPDEPPFSERAHPAEEGILEKILAWPHDVVRSPRTTYGKENVSVHRNSATL